MLTLPSHRPGSALVDSRARNFLRHLAPSEPRRAAEAKPHPAEIPRGGVADSEG